MYNDDDDDDDDHYEPPSPPSPPSHAVAETPTAAFPLSVVDASSVVVPAANLAAAAAFAFRFFSRPS
jgi:hypothetical protein